MALIYKKTFYNKIHNEIFSFEFAKKHNPSIRITLDECDKEINIIISCYYFLSFSFFIRNKKFWPFLKKISKEKDYLEKELYFYYYENSLWWGFWINMDEWNKKTPKWRRGSFNLLDFLAGSYIYSSKYIKEPTMKIYWKNEEVNCLIQEFKSYWNRPRLGFIFNKSITRYNCVFGILSDSKPLDNNYKWRYKNTIEFPCEDIPQDLTNVEYFIEIPTKGTSKPKWDDNSTYSITGFSEAKNINDAKLYLIKWFYESKLK